MLDNVVGHRHAANGLLEVKNLLCVEHLSHVVGRVGCCLLDNLHLVVERGVVEPDVEHEAVELSLGQRVGSLLLDGVLGGEHEEGRRQGPRGAGDSY